MCIMWISSTSSATGMGNNYARGGIFIAHLYHFVPVWFHAIRSFPQFVAREAHTGSRDRRFSF